MMEINLSNKCRVCLCDDKEMNNLLDEVDNGIILREILVNTTGFQVQMDDGLSPFMCHSCTTIVIEFYNLKTIYNENENHVKSLIKEQKVLGKESVEGEEILEVFDTESSIKGTKKEGSDDYITIKVECFGSDTEEGAIGDFNSNSNEANDTEHDFFDVGEEDNQIIDTQDLENRYIYQEINTYTCPECGDCFLYKNEIYAHMVSKHDTTDVDYDEISELSLMKVKKDDQSSSSNKCKICNEHFACKDVFKQHLETHKKNVCDICGMGFIKKSYLKDHQEVHCTEKRHVCGYCNKAFKRRTVLVKHKRIHTHPRECICEMCGKAFNDKGTLKTHIMLLHVRERNYMCLICGVKFPLKATLEKHIRRHQNKEREFFCTQCPLGYRDKSSLDRHVFVKHSGQNVKSTCTDCGRQYTTLSNLFKHQRACHNMSSKSIEQSE